MSETSTGRSLNGIPEIRTFFRTNQQPIYFVGPTAFNLLGIDRWVRNFQYVVYYDSWDGTHPRVFAPQNRPYVEFESSEQINNYLLRDPEVKEHLRRRGGTPMVAMVFFDDETEEICRELGYQLILPPDALRRRLDSKIVTTELGNEAGAPSVPNILGTASTYEELTLEGYGPGGVAVLVEGNTDNRNRAVSEIRHIFTKHGGNLGTAGCVSYMFTPRGYIRLPKAAISEDDLMTLALDAGADDIQGEGDVWEVYTAPDKHDAVAAALTKAGVTPEESNIGKFAQTTVLLEGPKAQQMLKLMEALEDHDDVQNVWANFDISEKEMEAAAAS